MEFVLELRRQYLSQYGSAVVLKHWDQIGDRLRASARTSEGVEEWGSDVMRKLRLGSPSKDSSTCLRELCDYVAEHASSSLFLDLIEKEHAYLLSLARNTAEKQVETRQAEKSLIRQHIEETLP
jgi:hypothetical protein